MTIEQKKIAADWFATLRNRICAEFELIEQEYGGNDKFIRKNWDRAGGGGGEMSLMNGKVFEKVGVNISSVFGEFSPEFCKEIPGTEHDPEFWASGISVVAHMHSPLVPAVHFNTRFIVTSKSWFGGGSDLTPCIENLQDKDDFHQALKRGCDKFDVSYYPKYKKACDEYFFLPNRGEMRGVGGVFYDYLNSNNWQRDLDFTKELGETFLTIFPLIVRRNMRLNWTQEQKQIQLIKRGRYSEFNLLYDRGTRFGLMTGGNTEAILMSLPPLAAWV